MIGTPVGMLPQRAVILLMHADGILDSFRGARHVDHMRVEVVNRADAIASKSEAVGHTADAVFAHIEHILLAMRSRRIAIRHLHLGQRSAVQNWTDALLILIGDLMKYEALPRCKADAKTPFLPAHLIAVYGEARSLGL